MTREPIYGRGDLKVFPPLYNVMPMALAILLSFLTDNFKVKNKDKLSHLTFEYLTIVKYSNNIVFYRQII